MYLESVCVWVVVLVWRAGGVCVYIGVCVCVCGVYSVWVWVGVWCVGVCVYR